MKKALLHTIDAEGRERNALLRFPHFIYSPHKLEWQHGFICFEIFEMSELEFYMMGKGGVPVFNISATGYEAISKQILAVLNTPDAPKIDKLKDFDLKLEPRQFNRNTVMKMGVGDYVLLPKEYDDAQKARHKLRSLRISYRVFNIEESAYGVYVKRVS